MCGVVGTRLFATVSLACLHSKLLIYRGYWCCSQCCLEAQWWWTLSVSCPSPHTHTHSIFPNLCIAGIAVGHVYYFLEDVFPNKPGGFKILKTPAFLWVPPTPHTPTHPHTPHTDTDCVTALKETRTLFLHQKNDLVDLHGEKEDNNRHWQSFLYIHALLSLCLMCWQHCKYYFILRCYCFKAMLLGKMLLAIYISGPQNSLEPCMHAWLVLIEAYMQTAICLL